LKGATPVSKYKEVYNDIKEKITNENNSITSTTDITNLRVVDLTLEKEGKLTKELAELFYNNTNRRQG